MHLTAGSVNDMHAMDQIVYEPGSFYIFDRGYMDYERLFVIQEPKSFFVIRAKNNLQFKRQYSYLSGLIVLFLQLIFLIMGQSAYICSSSDCS
jgi:hypothetical protein